MRSSLFWMIHKFTPEMFCMISTHPKIHENSSNIENRAESNFNFKKMNHDYSIRSYQFNHDNRIANEKTS